LRTGIRKGGSSVLRRRETSLTERFDVGPISVINGSMGYGVIPVARMSSGFEINIPMHVIVGDVSGPVLCVLSCIHAHEYTSIDVIRQLVLNMRPKDISGTIIAIPVANTMAFSMTSRGNWFDGMWGTHGDLGRAFPGNPIGWIVERIAHVFTKDIIPKVDVILDFHGEAPNRKNFIYYPYLHQGEDPISQETKNYVLNLGTDIIVKVGPSKTGSMGAQLQDLRKICIEVEISDFYGLEGEDRSTIKRTATEIGLTCVKNTMKKMGILNGKPKLPSKQVILDDYARITPKNGGLMRPEVTRRDIGRIMRKGEVIARVFDAYTLKEIEQLKAPFNKTMLLAIKEGTPFYQVEPAECDASGFEVCDWSKAVWISN
jgi:predicted deacylase